MVTLFVHGITMVTLFVHGVWVSSTVVTSGSSEMALVIYWSYSSIIYARCVRLHTREAATSNFMNICIPSKYRAAHRTAY